jgi:single-strand selective monofunctional uracil DNA glycosylase
VQLAEIAIQMSEELAGLRFGPPVTHVYNPLEYAFEAHQKYLKRWAKKSADVMLLGMNPGPFGMAQTGVPFGEVAMVRDWLGIEARVGKPKQEHPKRPIEGFACKRSEVSGARLWGWIKETFGTPDQFAKRMFIGNYCPLVFMEETGRNRTPDKLAAGERMKLFEICDRALRRTVECLEPKFVVGVGTFAEERAQVSLLGLEVKIGRILHPSPASPSANTGWAKTVSKQLRELGVVLP